MFEGNHPMTFVPFLRDVLLSRNQYFSQKLLSNDVMWKFCGNLIISCIIITPSKHLRIKQIGRKEERRKKRRKMKYKSKLILKRIKLILYIEYLSDFKYLTNFPYSVSTYFTINTVS